MNLALRQATDIAGSFGESLRNTSSAVGTEFAFMIGMKMIALPILTFAMAFSLPTLAAPKCAPAAELQARRTEIMQEAKQLDDARSVVSNEITGLNNDLAEARRLMAREQANPSGVVDLAYLHNLGVRIQYDLEQLDIDQQKMVELDKAGKALIIEAKQIVACLKEKK